MTIAFAKELIVDNLVHGKPALADLTGDAARVQPFDVVTALEVLRASGTIAKDAEGKYQLIARWEI